MRDGGGEVRACNLGGTDGEDDDEEKRNKQGVMLTCGSRALESWWWRL